MRWWDGGTGLAFLGPGSQLGSAKGPSLHRLRGGGGNLAIYTRAEQPVTVVFQYLQEAEWVWGTVQGHGPQLGFVRQRLAPFSSAGCIAPESGTLCPLSSLRKQIQEVLRLTRLLGSFRGPEALRWPPPSTPGGSP